jgi:hypothetical protein
MGGSHSTSFRFLAGPLPADDLTHSLYPYPARLIRHVPRFLLRSEGFVGAGTPIVLDPFCGSGTVLVEAQAAGLDAIGIDSNPVAALVSSVKTTPLRDGVLLDLAGASLSRAKKARTSAPTESRLARWYSAEAFSALHRLAVAIASTTDGPEKRALQVSFALTARLCSRMDPRIPVPVLSKNGSGTAATAASVWATFVASAERVSERVARIRQSPSAVTILHGDSRDSTLFESFENREVILLTSPPYGAAQKYARSTAIEGTWLGLISELGPAAIESVSIGREHILAADKEPSLVSLDQIPGLVSALKELRARDPRRADIYAHYFLDMNDAVNNFCGKLPTLRRIALVAGTNVVAGAGLPTHLYIASLFENAGFETIFDIEDEIRGRTLLTNRHRGNAPARSEFVYVMERP